MEYFALPVLILASLALPAILFLLFRPRARASRLVAAAAGIAVGWSFNVACVVAVEAITAKGAAQGDGDNLAIVTSFG